MSPVVKVYNIICESDRLWGGYQVNRVTSFGDTMEGHKKAAIAYTPNKLFTDYKGKLLVVSEIGTSNVDILVQTATSGCLQRCCNRVLSAVIKPNLATCLPEGKRLLRDRLVVGPGGVTVDNIANYN